MVASFTILTGILSGPVAFFGFKFLIILLISTTAADSLVKSLSSEITSFLTNLIFGCFLYVLIIYSTTNLTLFSSHFELILTGAVRKMFILRYSIRNSFSEKSPFYLSASVVTKVLLLFKSLDVFKRWPFCVTIFKSKSLYN